MNTPIDPACKLTSYSLEIRDEASGALLKTITWDAASNKAIATYPDGRQEEVNAA